MNGRFFRGLVYLSGPVALCLVLTVLLTGGTNLAEGGRWVIPETGTAKVMVRKSELGRISGGQRVTFQKKYAEPPIVVVSWHPEWGHTVVHTSNVTTEGFLVGCHVHLSIDQELPDAPHVVLVDYVVVAKAGTFRAR